jgi:hypothetical protein
MLIKWPIASDLEAINPELVGWMQELSDDYDTVKDTPNALTDYYHENFLKPDDWNLRFRFSFLIDGLEIARLYRGETDTTQLREALHTVYQRLILYMNMRKGSATDRELQLLRAYEQSITHIVNNVYHILAYLENDPECEWLRRR